MVYQYGSYMGPIWGLYCEINGSHMGPTCNLNMGPPDGFCKWFGDGTSMGSVYGSYVGLTRVLYGKLHPSPYWSNI